MAHSRQQDLGLSIGREITSPCPFSPCGRGQGEGTKNQDYGPVKIDYRIRPTAKSATYSLTESKLGWEAESGRFLRKTFGIGLRKQFARNVVGLPDRLIQIHFSLFRQAES